MAKKKVLIVDDDPNIVQSISFVLEKEGYTVFSAFDGEKAFIAAKENLPQLIILDIMLPKMDGFQVYRLLKAEPQTREIRTIVLTAKGEEKDKRLGKDLGVDAYITKPFNIDTLLLEVKKVLNYEEE